MTEPKQGPQMIDPIQYGQLLARVETLTSRVEVLTDRLEEIEDKFTLGRGVIFGLIVAAGFAAYGVKGMIDKWLAP